MHAYEAALLVPREFTDIATSPLDELAWAEFWLSPRMLRGSDFLMRWSQGVWSEKRLLEATNATSQFFALPYGPSGVAPEEPRAVELYFERLEAAGMHGQKRPDLLIFRSEHEVRVKSLVAEIGGEEEIPFIPDADPRIQAMLDLSILAVECENSLWVASKMPKYGAAMNLRSLASGKPGFAKNAVLPTIILKEEDRQRLDFWQSHHRVPIHIWHVFFDRAFGLSFDNAKDLISSGKIAPTEQVFQAPGGATTRKRIYKIYYHYAYELGIATAEPTLKAQVIVDKNGHVLPYVAFEGGSLRLGNTAISTLGDLRSRSGQ